MWTTRHTPTSWTSAATAVWTCAVTTELDPEGVEAGTLLAATDFTGARVLEIGCGDGRLAFRYASGSGTVVAVELDQQPIAKALKNCPPHLRERVALVQANALALPFRRERFDIAVLAWSL